METIRNYLEKMFATLPATPEVHKAKQELLSMMEDKYTELTCEGKPENEAVSIVISEFGNLDELAETLGISGIVVEQQETVQDVRQVTMEEAKKFMEAYSMKTMMIGLGVFCFIMAPMGPVFADAFHGRSGIGASLFLTLVAVGVAMVVLGNSYIRNYKYLRRGTCMLDYQTTGYVQEQIKDNQSTKTLLRVIGISLCVMCMVPMILLNELGSGLAGVFSMTNIDDVGVICMFLFVAIGVWLIIFSNGKTRAGKLLLHVNPKGTMSETYVVKEEPLYKDRPGLSAVMGEYWFTVTCLYLALSFLTFQWWITWIIWPLAAIVHAIINHSVQNAQKEGVDHE